MCVCDVCATDGGDRQRTMATVGAATVDGRKVVKIGSDGTTIEVRHARARGETVRRMDGW
jgi:hypothetical protein